MFKDMVDALADKRTGQRHTTQEAIMILRRAGKDHRTIAANVEKAIIECEKAFDTGTYGR